MKEGEGRITKLNGLLMRAFSIPLESLNFPLILLPHRRFSFSSVRPSSGRFRPHARYLHAQQPAVPSTHGTISFLSFFMYIYYFFIHTGNDTYQVGAHTHVELSSTRLHTQCNRATDTDSHCAIPQFCLWKCWCSSRPSSTNELLTEWTLHTRVTSCDNRCLFWLS